MFDILHVFGKRSAGCKVNIDKSTAFYFGSGKVNVMKAFSTEESKWVTNTIKYIGVQIPIQNCDPNSIIDQRFSSVNDKIYTEPHILWSSRG